MKRFVCVIAAVLLGSLLVPLQEVKAQPVCLSPGLPYASTNLYLGSRYGSIVSPEAVASGFDATVVGIHGGTRNGFHIERISFSVYIELPFLYPALLTQPILTFQTSVNGRRVNDFSEPLNPTNGDLNTLRWGFWEYEFFNTGYATDFEIRIVRSVLPPADVLMRVRVSNICIANRNHLPTRTPTPTATFTPITHTPTASGTPTPITHTPTMTPIVISMEDIQRPPMLSDECRDIANPCSIFPTIAFATIALPSPTRRPTLAFTPTPSITPSPTETATPTNTPTPNQTITVTPTDCWGYCDPTAVADFGGAVATAGAFRLDIVDARGTPIGFDTAVRLGALAGGVFAVVRSFANTENPASWLIGILLLSVGFIAFVWVLVYFVPILLRMAGLLMQLLQILLRVVR